VSDARGGTKGIRIGIEVGASSVCRIAITTISIHGNSELEGIKRVTCVSHALTQASLGFGVPQMLLVLAKCGQTHKSLDDDEDSLASSEGTLGAMPISDFSCTCDYFQVRGLASTSE
jgi:hypothetical protein